MSVAIKVTYKYLSVAKSYSLDKENLHNLSPEAKDYI